MAFRPILFSLLVTFVDSKVLYSLREGVGGGGRVLKVKLTTIKFTRTHFVNRTANLLAYCLGAHRSGAPLVSGSRRDALLRGFLAVRRARARRVHDCRASGTRAPAPRGPSARLRATAERTDARAGSVRMRLLTQWVASA